MVGPAPFTPRAIRSTSVPPRRSARLAGEPPGGEWELRPHSHRQNGVLIERTVRWNRWEVKSYGDWSYRVNKTSRRKPFYPGQLIMAMDLHPQTILSRPLTDPQIAQTECGPVNAKMRVMVVINTTFNGILCLPMYTQTSNTVIPAPRVREMVSISQNRSWPGATPWVGPPLHMTMYGGSQYAANSFIELCQPVHVLAQSRIKDIGYISGGEYARLIRLLAYKENEARRNAFQLYHAQYFTNQMWVPGARYRSYHKAQMDRVTYMRWR
ncbi:unnamed protein product [Aureobasidium uvarum]|uniref:Uncharacterized protein n=1 Tax=Aureobasidium uvarum TaxID=2773716 RepID=A0A9N8PPI1_9PEZI|nr:unnamed protein product [Aureobasidium uvarum]